MTIVFCDYRYNNYWDREFDLEFKEEMRLLREELNGPRLPMYYYDPETKSSKIKTFYGYGY